MNRPFANKADEIEFYKSMTIGFEDAANRKDELITSLIMDSLIQKDAENTELLQKRNELGTKLAAEKKRLPYNQQIYFLAEGYCPIQQRYVEPFIQSSTVSKIIENENGIFYTYSAGTFTSDDVGISIFLAPEDARVVLEKRKINRIEKTTNAVEGE